MINEKDELERLLARIRGGDGDAARELLVQFEPQVRRVVRRRLPEVMRSKFDSMDFVQSVWGDFFDRLNHGEIDFSSPKQLARFLALAARAKIVNEFRKRIFTEKYDVTREVSLEEHDEGLPLISTDPSPSQTALAKDRFDEMLEGRPELHRRVLQLRLEGLTFLEIAAQTGIDERSARRIVDGVEEKDKRGNAADQ